MGLHFRQRIYLVLFISAITTTIWILKRQEEPIAGSVGNCFRSNPNDINSNVIVLNGRHSLPNHQAGTSGLKRDQNPSGRREARLGQGGVDKQNVNAVNDSNNEQQLCVFPKQYFYGPDTSKLFKPVEPRKCAGESLNGPEVPWGLVENDTLRINPRAIEMHGNITCDYHGFWRISDQEIDFKHVNSVRSGFKIVSDFFRLDCKSEDGSSQTNIMTSVVRDSKVVERARKILSTKISPNVSAKAGPSDDLNSRGRPLNIYMLGFDTMSRINVERKLPKTYAFLKNNLDATVLEGYNIVGDGTPQALIPILTGKTELELPLTRKRYASAKYVNSYPFIWNDFRDNGYATLYGEDAAAIGTFTYRLKGFKDQPTDHYMRPFYLEAERLYTKWRRFCIGPEAHELVHFRYVEQFWAAYWDIPKFAFQFHSILSHDDKNAVELADETMVGHLTRFKENGWLDNTLLIFMSDHGPRFSGFRDTQQGKMEERLPFFSLILPKWFAKVYPGAWKNLNANLGRLTTPFDIYATFKTVLNGFPDTALSAKSLQASAKGHGFDSGPKQTISQMYENAQKPARSLSLFEPISPARSCEDAGIEPHWCACLSWEVVSTEDQTVQRLACTLVWVLNNETLVERERCASLNLSAIVSASKYIPTKSLLQFKKTLDYDGFDPDLSGSTAISEVHYQIKFQTQPGSALYEASLSWDVRTMQTWVDLNSISRINAFGDRPHCVIDRDYFLAKWCVCYDKI